MCSAKDHTRALLPRQTSLKVVWSMATGLQFSIVSTSKVDETHGGVQKEKALSEDLRTSMPKKSEMGRRSFTDSTTFIPCRSSTLMSSRQLGKCRTHSKLSLLWAHSLLLSCPVSAVSTSTVFLTSSYRPPLLKLLWCAWGWSHDPCSRAHILARSLIPYPIISQHPTEPMFLLTPLLKSHL